MNGEEQLLDTDCMEMLIYKGVNFLDHALGKKQQLLQKSLLFVPQHLEHVDQYIHVGKLPDSRFREPWTRAQVEKNFLESERSKLQNEINSLSNVASSWVQEIEPPDRYSFEALEHGVFDLGEFVPSSDPSSLEDFNEELPSECHLEEKEIFTKEDIQHRMSPVIRDSQKLEELVTSDPLVDLRKNLPNLNVLRGRLHLNQVSDPLHIKHPKLISLKKDLTQHEKLSQLQSDVTQLPKYEIYSKDLDCQKYEFCSTDDVLEEFLSPLQTNPVADKEDVIKTAQTTLNVDSCEIVELKSPTSHLAEAVDILVKSTGDKKHHGEIEKLSDPGLLKESSLSFLKINEANCVYELDVEKVLLDSPLPSPCVDNKSQIFPLTQMLSRLEAEPIREGCERFLTFTEREEIMWRIWQGEKCFDDTLALRYPESEERPRYDINIDSTWAKNMLNLKPYEDLGKVELCLCWDALSASASEFSKKSNKVERMSDVCSKELVPSVQPVEQFDTCNVSLLFESRDVMLEVTSNSHLVTGDTSVNVLKTEKAAPPTLREKPLPMTFNCTGGDPLSDFLMLRSVQHPSVNNRSANTAYDNSKTQKRKGQSLTMITNSRNDLKSNSPEMSELDLDIQKHGTAVVNKKKKKWHIIKIPVTMKGEFVTCLDIIENQASFYIAALKEYGDNFPSHDFFELTPDITRFLLKQKEKMLSDSKSNSSTCDSYKATVVLHTLCGAHDILLHACFESALAHIKAMQEKYQFILKNCLDDMRKELFQMKCIFYQRRIFHPKFVALYKEIDAILQNSFKNDKEKKEKILIVTERDLPSLKCSLQSFLCGESKMKAEILTEVSKASILKLLECGNCLIAHRSDIQGLEFPWSEISGVIWYDFKEDESLQDMCKSHDIPLTILDIKQENMAPKADLLTQKETDAKVTSEPLTIIGSRYLTSKPELLQLLETRHNLTILERDFDKIESLDKLYFADLIIDERNCLVFQSLHDMTEVWQIEPFIKKIVTLSLKFSICWVVFYSFYNQKSKYPFSGSCIENIIRFQAAIANFTKKQEFSVKTFVGDNVKEVASFVRKVCNISRKESPVWKGSGWTNRAWLTEESTKEEQTLMTFPCFSSFSAQLLLHKMSFSNLLMCPYSDLIRNFPEIPSKFMRMFCEMVHSDKGLKLGSSHHSDVMSVTFQKPYQDDHIDNDRNFRSVAPVSANKFGNFTDKSHNELTPEKLYDTDLLHRPDISKKIPSVQCQEKKLSEVMEPVEMYVDDQQSTQDSEDILSLNGSQPSVVINEYQRAEMEGQTMIAIRDQQKTSWNKQSQHSKFYSNLQNYQQQGTGYSNTYKQGHLSKDMHLTQAGKSAFPEKIESEIAAKDLEVKKGKDCLDDIQVQDGYIQRPFSPAFLNELQPQQNLNRPGYTIPREIKFGAKYIDQLPEQHLIQGSVWSNDITRKCTADPQLCNIRALETEDESALQSRGTCQGNDSATAKQMSYGQIFSEKKRNVLGSEEKNVCHPKRQPSLLSRPKLMGETIHVHTSSKSPHRQHSFASDLALTTQYILRQAATSNLPRNHFPWPPPHRVSIGLAQPRRREDFCKKDQRQPVSQQHNCNNDTSDGANPSFNKGCPQIRVVTREHEYPKNSLQGSPQLQQQSSLWSSYNSPPMDLDHEVDYIQTTQPNTQSQKPSGGIYPMKEKKLSYTRVPGLKGGQTKLVFKH